MSLKDLDFMEAKHFSRTAAGSPLGESPCAAKMRCPRDRTGIGCAAHAARYALLSYRLRRWGRQHLRQLPTPGALQHVPQRNDALQTRGNQTLGTYPASRGSPSCEMFCYTETRTRTAQKPRTSKISLPPRNNTRAAITTIHRQYLAGNISRHRPI